MSKILSLRRTSTLALRQRKAQLLRSFQPPAQLLHASLIERFLKCGKANCHCHTGGPKHGPFFYLNRCFGPGQVQSLLLKSPEQVAAALRLVAAGDFTGPLRELFLRRFTLEQHLAGMAAAIRSVEAS